MYHSLNIGGKNTWEEWHIVPSSLPIIAQPSIKENLIDIAGTNGVLNATSLLTGHPLFGMREGSIEFYILDQNGDILFDEETWHNTYTSMLFYLHGKEYTMFAENDPLESARENENVRIYRWRYEGMFSVSNMSQDRTFSKITLNYKLNPYRLASYPMSQLYPVLHSPFVFNGETDLIAKFDVLNKIDKMPVVPNIISSNRSSLIKYSFINKELNINIEDASFRADQNRDGRIVLSNFSGNNEMSLILKEGNGETISFDYTNGRL